ncbi:MAG: DNA mismatch repair protein MutS [Candidatus Omnitrophota bacterium]
MLKQYNSIKSRHKDCILFFRLGDFYEMFMDDAKTASRILDLVLTRKSAGKAGKIPMCGIPFHAADSYIARLIKAGQKVAICEQVEDPQKAKGLVKRDVIRVITNGTYIDETSHNPRYLLSISLSKKSFGIAFCDASGGTIFSNQYYNPQKLISIISKLPLFECIYPVSDEDNIKGLFGHPNLRIKKIQMSPYEDWAFNHDISSQNLREHFSVSSLKGFGIDNMAQAASSSGALLQYLKQMNRTSAKHIDKISLYADENYAFISPSAVYGLELEELIRTIDNTLTSLGKRKFKHWVFHPLKDVLAIKNRQQAIILLKENSQVQEEIHTLFSGFPDIEKNLSRLSYGYPAAKDIFALRNAFIRIPDLQISLQKLPEISALLMVADIPALREKLEEAINPDMPLSKPEGRIIREGFNKELDDLRDIQKNAKDWLKKLQQQEIKKTGINSLKIGFNRVFGYYIEISKANQHLAPNNYIRKQTLVNGERFITPELKEFEEKILNAETEILKIENELLREIQGQILGQAKAINVLSQQISTIDCLYSLSILANKQNYICPAINNTSEINIEDGIHPVVETHLTEEFIPNDTALDCKDNHLLIITGPNMAGKSTYIRQTAILTIMAQIGSYIPAKKASIGIVDKIFTRIGAHDNIAKGYSTFMVEMSEAAEILNNLTPKSLIILDEIGRGTSTYDGLSLAWAIAEYIAKSKTRTLFATHFHELTSLAEKNNGIKNYNIAVKEWKDEIVFLHKIIPGGCDDSYGIYVAKIAGVPSQIIERGKDILTKLETQSDLQEKITASEEGEKQLTFFSPVIPAPDSNIRGQAPAGNQNHKKTTNKKHLDSLVKPENDSLFKKLEEQITKIDINTTTPLQALEKLKTLKETVTENRASTLSLREASKASDEAI